MSTISDVNDISQIKAINVKNGHAALLATWQNSIDLIWDSPNPQAVLDDMSINAEDLFEKSIKTVSFLESISPGCCTDRLAKILDYTVNNDGTITID